MSTTVPSAVFWNSSVMNPLPERPQNIRLSLMMDETKICYLACASYLTHCRVACPISKPPRARFWAGFAPTKHRDYKVPNACSTAKNARARHQPSFPRSCIFVWFTLMIFLFQVTTSGNIRNHMMFRGTGK